MPACVVKEEKHKNNKKKEAYFQVQNTIQKQGHVSSSFVGIGLHPVSTVAHKAYQTLERYLTWSCVIEKANHRKQVLDSNAASSQLSGSQTANSLALLLFLSFATS